MILGGIGLIIAGYAVYRYFFLSDATSELQAIVEKANPDLLNQPSQVTPFAVSDSPRVDNADQPWYNGNTDFLTLGDAISFDTDLFTYSETIH